jgi:hypothetical protein
LGALFFAKKCWLNNTSFNIRKLNNELYSIKLNLPNMKKPLLLAASLLVAATSISQTNWVDDFESYSAGDFIGAFGTGNYWSTWSGAANGAEDAQVSNAESVSGAKILFILIVKQAGGHKTSC